MNDLDDIGRGGNALASAFWIGVFTLGVILLIHSCTYEPSKKPVPSHYAIFEVKP